MATYSGSDKRLQYLFNASNNFAEDYDNTHTYAVNDYAIYQGKLYKCIIAVIVAENFDYNKWELVKVTDEMGSGGGGGTTVIANPADSSTDTLNKLQVGSTIYDVPSGGGSSGHTYSTTEHIVGKWIDGRDIYECTYDLGSNITISYNSWTTLSVIIANLNFIVNCFGTNEGGTFTPLQASWVVATHAIQVQTPRNNYTQNIRYMTIQYCKEA